MADEQTAKDETASDELNEAHRHADPKGDDEGEDEGGAAKEGNEDHLKEDQKTPKN